MSPPLDPETTAHGRANRFTTTHWSVVLAARGNGSLDAQAALETLCRVYWYPLYAFVRRQGYGPHEAQDLTQGFFARLLAKNYLQQVERDKGKFRSFLLASLSHFLSNERDRTNAAKRGGGKVLISLDETVAEESRRRWEPISNLTPEREFEKQWAISLLEHAFAKVQDEYAAAGKERIFAQLKPFLAEGTGSGDYADVAAELGMSANTIAVMVGRMRRRYRALVRAEIERTVATQAEIEDEMRHLFEALVQ